MSVPSSSVTPATRPFSRLIAVTLVRNSNRPPLASAARCRLWDASAGSDTYPDSGVKIAPGSSPPRGAVKSGSSDGRVGGQNSCMSKIGMRCLVVSVSQSS